MKVFRVQTRKKKNVNRPEINLFSGDKIVYEKGVANEDCVARSDRVIDSTHTLTSPV